MKEVKASSAILKAKKVRALLFYGDRLAELREDRKWSQKQLSEQLGVTVQTISEYENNKTCPSLEKVVRLALLFDVSIDYLCGLTDELFSYKRENCIILPRQQHEAMRNEILHFVELVKCYYSKPIDSKKSYKL